MQSPGQEARLDGKTPQRGGLRKWAFFTLRWGIAVVGIWWVVSNLTLRDHVAVLDERNIPQRVKLAAPAEEEAKAFEIHDPKTGQRVVVPRERVVNLPSEGHKAWVLVREQEKSSQLKLLGLDLTDDLRRVNRLLVQDEVTQEGKWFTTGQVVGDYQLKVPRPRVEVGMISMLKLADAALLAASVLVFPLTYLITSFRWNRLLAALDIRLTQARTFVINMVGAFYNSFMPGSTGGDFLKAYYASKQTSHKAGAVISVFIDRVIGLLGLVLLGGAMAGYQYSFAAQAAGEATVTALQRVAIGSLVVFVGAFTAMIVFGATGVRKALGIDYVLAKLPLQKHVQHALHVGRVYKSRPGLMAWALLISLPVHMTVVVSALLAGKALDLPIPAPYYFVIVPVIVLSGALPISFQGAGVMEFFAIQLTKQYGTTVAQAFALTMSIRFVQLLWNLTGGVFVFRGGYHAPTAREQEELEKEEQREIAELEKESAPSLGTGS